MLFSDTAFILRVDILSEKDVVTALLTRDRGLVRAVVHGARGRSKRAAALQLLTEVEVSVFRREGNDLGSVREIEILKSAFDLALRAETALLLPYMAESTLAFSPPDMATPETYRLLHHVLDVLRAGRAPAALAARYFEFWILKLAGVFPGVKSCEACGNLIAGAAVFAASGPHIFHPECGERGWPPVRAATLTLLQSFGRTPLDRIGVSEGADVAALAGAEAISREVRRRFLGFELKSYELLGVLDPGLASPC